MSTIEELIKLQQFQLNPARPLTVRGQYSKNTNTDINKTIQSVSLLTTELNKLNSSVQESALNTGAVFSMKQWVRDTATTLAQQLFPSIQTLIGNQRPITKKILLTNTVITAAIQATLNQQDNILNQLEDQVYKILEKQNNVKVVKDKDGNPVLTPILTENAQKSLDNVIKILSSTTTTLEKINTRISNEKPIKNINDFVNNLSLEQIIEFAEKIIAVVTIALQIKIRIRQVQDLATSIAATATNPPLSKDYAQRAVQYTASEQKQMEDLASAQITISVVKAQILFYQEILQTIINKLQDILDLLNSLQVTPQTPNPQLQQLTNQIQTLIDNQQQTQDTITKKLIEPEFIQINKPNYAARIIK
jgi:hypothetical protein